MSNKHILIINLKGSLGGAEIRYISLFNEILKRKNDYFLIINRKLYEIALEAGYLYPNDKIVILEIDQYIPSSSLEKQVQNKKIKKDRILLKKIKKIGSIIVYLTKYFYYIYSLHKVFKINKPKYVYSVWVGGMIAWPLKYIYRFKFIYSYMDSGFSSLDVFWKHPFKSERLPLKHANIIDFLSAGLYMGIQKKVTLKKKTKISITTCSFKNYDNIKSATQKLNTVTFCSRMTQIKNPLLLLDSIIVFNQIYKEWQEVKFQFLGNGECLDQMENFVQKHKLDNVELLGHVNNPMQYLSKSKIFISIQKTNNYPSQSLLEAMACENAIVASDVGETRKLVTENEGILVCLNAQEIAEAIIKLIEDEPKRKMLAQNARKKVLAEHNIEKYLDYFYSLEKL
jgi:glycosyltransferase involved in cell wall biosynthesis